MHKQQTLSKVYIKLTEYLFKCQKLDVNFMITKTLIEHIDDFPDIYIEEIAYLAKTTPASITKFCKKLGYHSFKEMRTDLASYNDEVLMEHIGQGDTVADFIDLFLKKELTIEKYIFDHLDHAQCLQIANTLKSKKTIAVLGNSYSFSGANFFRELLSQEGYIVFEVNRSAEQEMLVQLLNEVDMCFFISLTGKWLEENAEWLMETSAKKCLLTQQALAKVDGIDDIVSFSAFDFLMLSNYYSQKVIHFWIILFARFLRR